MKPKAYFDFNTNSWTHESPLLQAAPEGAEAWSMPEFGSWVVPSKRVASFEDRLIARPWLAAIYFLVLLGVWFCRFELGVDQVSLAAFVVCAVVPFLAIATIYAVDGNPQSFARAHETIEDPQDSDVCPVVLTIFQNGLVTGEDVGVAWFDGPSLYYNGNTCSFVIGRRDLQQEAAWRLAAHLPLVGHENMLFLRSTGNPIGIRLVPAFYANHVGDIPEPGRRFLDRRKEFRPGSGGPEHSSYPPLSVSPTLKEDPLPFRNLIWLQMFGVIYFSVLAMLAGAPMWLGLTLAAFCALSTPSLRPRRNPRVFAKIDLPG